MPAQTRPRNAIRSTSSGISGPRTDGAADRIRGSVSDGVGPHKFGMWFSRTRFGVVGDHLEVATDTTFAARWIDGHFAADLRRAAAAELGDGATVGVEVRPELFGLGGGEPAAEDRPADTDAAPPTSAAAPNGAAGRTAAPPAAPDRNRGPARGAGPGFRRLSDFVVGECNRLAYSAAARIVEEPEPAMNSPLFIHGECGVGKTHLLQGVSHRHGGLSQPGRVRYLTGEQFTNEYVVAVKQGNLDPFRRRVRKLELLAVDDVHFLSNKTRTQDEFLHTLDALALSGARVVMAADEHPRNIRKFHPALISRFLSGMVVQIERPDRATRVELIRRLAAARGLRLSEPAVSNIAARCVGSVRELEGVVTKLAALHALSGPDRGEVGMVLVDRLFAERTWRPKAPVRIGLVIDTVCERLHIGRADLMSTGRHRKVVLARALVAYLSRELTTHSYPEIAAAIGRTYHSTVHTAATRLRRQIDANETALLDGGEAPVVVRDLVDHLRHAILHAAR